jgi:LysM repeat protein
MQIPPQVSALLHNKPALIGVAGAAGLGLYVHSRNKTGSDAGGASDGVSSQDAASAAGSSGGTYSGTGLGDGTGQPTTYPNTYGTDLATALGDIDSRYADQVTAFQGKLGTDESALASIKTAQDNSAKSLAALSTTVATLTKPAATTKPGTPKTPTKTGGSTKPAPKVPASQHKTTTYKIKKGDTLSAIAKKYHTTISALTKANNIKNPNLIVTGHTLKIPG